MPSARFDLRARRGGEAGLAPQIQDQSSVAPLVQCSGGRSEEVVSPACDHVSRSLADLCGEVGPVHHSPRVLSCPVIGHNAEHESLRAGALSWDRHCSR